MNKKIFILLLIISTLNSCQSQSEKKSENYETETGEYTSKDGNFTIKIPVKPILNVIDNQIGMDKYKIYSYKAVAGQQMIYGIEYIDFPEYILKSWNLDDYYNQVLKTLESKYGGVFKLTTQNPTEQHNLKGQYFELSLNPDANIPRGVKGSIQGKIFVIENRVYTITYFGEEQELIESYLESFRLIK